MCPSPLKCQCSAVGQFSIWTGSLVWGLGGVLWDSSKNNVKRHRTHLLEDQFNKRQVFHRKQNEGMLYLGAEKHAEPTITYTATKTDWLGCGGRDNADSSKVVQTVFYRKLLYYYKVLRTNMMARSSMTPKPWKKYEYTWPTTNKRKFFAITAATSKIKHFLWILIKFCLSSRNTWDHSRW